MEGLFLWIGSNTVGSQYDTTQLLNTKDLSVRLGPFSSTKAL